MNKRLHLSLVAVAATVLTAAQLITTFASLTYLFYAALLTVMISGGSIAARTLRGPLWTQAAAMLAMLVIGMTWFFRSGDEIAGLLPSGASLHHFLELMRQARTAIQTSAPPVPDNEGLLFLTTFGLGLVAVLIDLFAVGTRRPALAGLPILAVYAVPVGIFDNGLPFVPFLLGSIGFLWLLMTDSIDRVRRFGRRFTGEGRDIDLWEPSPLAAAGRRLALAGIALAIVLPAVLPGSTSGLIDRLGNGGSGACPPGARCDGGGAAVNLFAVLDGELRRDEVYQMLSYTTTESNPYYLRLASADQLGPGGFTARDPGGGQTVNGAISADRPGQTYTAQLHIDRLNMNLLPIFLQPTQIRGLDNNWRFDATTNQLFSTRSLSKNKEYQVEYVRPDYTVGDLRSAVALPDADPIQQAFTTVPHEPFVSERVAALTRAETTPYGKARALYNSFSEANGFRYDVRTEPGTSGAKIVDFLQNKVGFCEQYAAALAWMAREAGLPARVAFGFTRGNQKVADTYNLTNQNLHAWTEIYFQGYGWVPFDATPSDRVAGSSVSGWAPNLTSAVDPSQTPDVEDTSKPTVGSSSGPTGPAGPRDPDQNGGGAVTPVEVISQWPTWLAFGGVLVLVAMIMPAIARRRLRRRRRPVFTGAAANEPAMLTGAGTNEPAMLGTMTPVPDSTVSRQDAHRTWDELLDTMIDFRIDPDPADSPRTTVERLIVRAELWQDAAASGRRLSRAEERARYARSVLTDVDLETELTMVRSGIAGQATRGARLMAALAPRSVLLRWREGALGSSTRAVNGFNTAVDTLVRALSPRRWVAAWLGRRADT